MANFARIINEIAVDVSTDPTNQFHPDIAVQFEPVPGEVKHGWVRTDGEWSAPEPVPTPEPTPEPVHVSPVQFKLLFTSAERLAIKAARDTDPTIDDFWDLLEDPRMTYVDLSLGSVQMMISYLATANYIEEHRVAEILSGNLV